jgi:S-adenosylmethionine-dependent methyltransferase
VACYRILADLSVPIRVPIWIASESQTTHPGSLHRLRCDVQNIIARTDGPRSWRELGPCEIQSRVSITCMYRRCWVQATWGKVYRAHDTGFRSGDDFTCRMTVPAKGNEERFQSGAQEYAAYLKTPAGRLRTDLALANLQDFLLPVAQPSWCALDVGCGTGATAVRLAQLGIHVTLIDSSPAMLDIAKRAAGEAGVADKVVLQRGDATQLANLFHARSFDVILFHNILEYCEDPGALLCGAARVLRDSSAILSVLVRNQAGEVFKAAIQAGDLAAATDGLTAERGQESLYGGSVRLFTFDGLRTMLKAASFVPIAERGVRVLADYLPPRVSRSEDYERIFDLERKLGSRPQYAAVARYTQCFARLT